MASKTPVRPSNRFRLVLPPHSALGFDEAEKFELPAELPTSTKGLEELRAEAERAFLAAHESSTAEGKIPTAEEIEELDRLSDAVAAIEAAHEKVQGEEQARADKAAELRDRVAGASDEDESDADADAGDNADADADADTGDSADADTDSTDQVDADADADVDKSLVAGAGKGAAGRKKKTFRGVGAASGRRSADQVPEKKVHAGFTLNTSLRGAKAGFVDTLGVAELSDSIHPGVVRMSPNGNDKREVSLATIERPFESQALLDEKSTAAEIENAINYVTDESRLKSEQGEGSLVAAGGWCAPSEIIYDYLGIPDAQDLYDMPELGIRRGGIRFPIQPDFGSLFQSPGFQFTEAEAIANYADPNYEKPCFEIPCDGFDEVRLGAIGLCITAGILQNKGFPELVKTYIDGILAAHQHRISAFTVAQVLAKSTAVTINADSVISAFDALLNSLELAQVDITTRHRLPYNTTIEVKLPIWARPALRNDLAKRRGVDVNIVTDAILDAHLASRRIKAQFLSDWQTSGAGAPGVAQPGAAVPVTRLPSSIQFIAYPAGTWFRSQANVIEVANLYDQAQLRRNRYTALFTEDGIAVGKRGLDSRVYTVPLEYTGGVGEALPLAPVAP